MFSDESTFDLPVPNAEFPRKELLLRERETLGVFVTGHPIEAFVVNTDTSLTEVIDGPVESTITASGVVTALKVWRTKNTGEEMAVIQFEDKEASIEVMAFPRTWNLYKHLLSVLAGVEMVVRKQMNMKDLEPKYVILEVNPLELKEIDNHETDGNFKLFLPRGFVSYDRGISQLKGAFLSHRGSKEIVLHISDSSVMKLGPDYLVDPSKVLLDEIAAIFNEFRGRSND
jgi:DNA polymerase-3 subunit alpha